MLTTAGMRLPPFSAMTAPRRRPVRRIGHLFLDLVGQFDDHLREPVFIEQHAVLGQVAGIAGIHGVDRALAVAARADEGVQIGGDAGLGGGAVLAVSRRAGGEVRIARLRHDPAVLLQRVVAAHIAVVDVLGSL
jgi:hypothetical protein